MVAKLEICKMVATVRCGYYQHTVVRQTCDVIIVGISEHILDGLEGIRKLTQDA